MSDFSMDQMVDYFVTLTSQQLKKSFDSEEAEGILSSFTQRFKELYETLKGEFNETQLFHGVNPIFVIALEESMPGKQGKKDETIVVRHVLAVYKMMLEDMVLEPQRRNMSLSKDPWSTFVVSTRTGNRKVYDNEYFILKEISSTKEEFAFDMNRCIYQEVFRKFGREDLGPIMCEYDSIIADNVSEWVRFEREETIATGCDKCTFRFYRIKKKYSDNPMVDSIYSFLQIIDNSDEMLTKQEIIEKGFDDQADLEDIIKLYELVKNHSGLKTSTENEELVLGNVNSYEKYEEWKLLFNRKISKEERSKIVRKLPLVLKEEKIKRLITDLLDNPYELASIKWVCLNYLQNHFSSRVEFEVEGIDVFQVNVGLLEDFRSKFPKISFETRSLDNTKITIQAYGKGVPEYKLKEPSQLLRREMVKNFPDAGISAIRSVISIDPVAKKFFDIFEDSNQEFQLRELALRILISRVGDKLVPFLNTIAENKNDDQFLRGRAIDSLSWFTSTLPQLYTTSEDFTNLPNPVKRSIVDFVARQGTEEDLLLKISINERNDDIIRIIAIRNLQTYQDQRVREFLLKLAVGKSNTERLRQASLEALEQHNVTHEGRMMLFKIFTNPQESTFIRMEAIETLKALNFKPEKETAHIDNPDWITSIGIKQIMEG
ncbi:MAG: L-2-amino-thiazoline-4-carboxylic acid hydrolase [Candidatus Hodarchaeales archaeon]|jgi:hypothetical protein